MDSAEPRRPASPERYTVRRMYQPEDVSSPGMRRRYALVIVIEAFVLASLWVLGRIYA